MDSRNKVSNQRSNTLHQLTTQLAKTKSVVVLEDLNVAGMLKNHHLAQAIGDVGLRNSGGNSSTKPAGTAVGWCLRTGGSRPSKTCSGCGWVDEELDLGDRMFHCQNPKVLCGLVLDRDLNAAINLAELAGSSPESQNACGGGSAGLRL